MKNVDFLFWQPRRPLTHSPLLLAVALVLGSVVTAGFCQQPAVPPGDRPAAEFKGQTSAPPEEKYAANLRLAQEALREADFDKAYSLAGAALAEKPGDQTADDIMTQASLERIYQNWLVRSRDPGQYANTAFKDAKKRLAKYAPFQAGMEVARKALNAGQMDIALKNVERALRVKPWDPTAQELKSAITNHQRPGK